MKEIITNIPTAVRPPCAFTLSGRDTDTFARALPVLYFGEDTNAPDLHLRVVVR